MIREEGTHTHIFRTRRIAHELNIASHTNRHFSMKAKMELSSGKWPFATIRSASSKTRNLKSRSLHRYSFFCVVQACGIKTSRVNIMQRNLIQSANHIWCLPCLTKKSHSSYLLNKLPKATGSGHHNMWLSFELPLLLLSCHSSKYAYCLRHWSGAKISTLG